MLTPALLAVASLAAPPPPVLLWGEEGHRIIGAAAAGALPEQMPAFFRSAATQLAYLNPEPDRWRSRAEREMDPAMDQAHAPEHYINLERVPAAALRAPDRYAFLDSLRAAGVDAPAPGLLPFRILELTQRVREGFRQWRAESDPRQRAFIEQRILNDAGILGHYVADGANPAHTTIHHNGWVGENPRGYATDRRFHARFESDYVRAHVRGPEVAAAVGAGARTFPDVRDAVNRYLRRSHSLVERLYQLDRARPYGVTPGTPETHAFAVSRMAAGAEMLRDLWWTAWATSAAGGSRVGDGP